MLQRACPDQPAARSAELESFSPAEAVARPHLLRSCGSNIVAALPHLSIGTVGEIARHAKHDAIERFGTLLCSDIQHGRVNPERHILVSARARPL